MTDTAKPTSFSLELSAELQKEIAEYANLIPLEPISAELIDVYTKTGLTPRQVLAQRDEYRSLLHRVFAESFGGYISWEGGDTENVYHIPCKIYDEVESALAKCGKVGG